MEYTIDIENIPSDIKVKKYTPKSSTFQYKVLSYDPKNILYDNHESIFRSVIFSEPENELLCFSHPQSVPTQNFQSKYPIINENIYINEIIEGTMIQLFYDSRKGSWEIATKGAIGGDYWFYRTQYPDSGIHDSFSQKTFRSMFLDVFPPLETFDKFPKNYCYQFILQHPDNHIVLNLLKPSIYLVGVYEISGKTAKVVMPTTYETWDYFTAIESLLFPRRFSVTSYDEITENYCSCQSDYKMIGCMITHLETGERMVIENRTYSEVRELRGNHPNLQYQYLCLRRMDKVTDFLGYFPQYKKIFYKFYKQYCNFLTNLHQSYLTYYIQKSGVKISKKYFPLIYRIHHIIYLPSLAQGEKKIMRLSEIAKYVKEMNPSELIHYLNYHLEENIEELKIANKDYDIGRIIV
jgi:hypothetical protein